MSCWLYLEDWETLDVDEEFTCVFYHGIVSDDIADMAVAILGAWLFERYQMV